MYRSRSFRFDIELVELVSSSISNQADSDRHELQRLFGGANRSSATASVEEEGCEDVADAKASDDIRGSGDRQRQWQESPSQSGPAYLQGNRKDYKTHQLSHIFLNLMEAESTATTTDTVTTITVIKNGKQSSLTRNEDKNKKRGTFTIIKAALFMMRRRSDQKTKPLQIEVASNVVLMRLGSMRPLHLQDNQSPPSSIHQALPSSPLKEAPASPQRSSTSSMDSISQYASATNLQALDKGGDQSRYSSSANLQELENSGLGSQYGSSTNLQARDDGSKSRYASSPNLQSLAKGSESQYASSPNLHALDNVLESRYASSPNLQALAKRSENGYASSSNLQALDIGSESQYASSPNLQALAKGSESQYASLPNLHALDKVAESQYASSLNLQALAKGSESRYASSPNLQALAKGLESQYVSSPNLQAFAKGSESRYASMPNLQALAKGSESRYASALNLQELDDDESDARINDNGGDEMIDAKAEEFIAQFYHQIRVQAVERYHKTKGKAKTLSA
ncbi:hypothetical protein CsSME_00047429 [Camellia sinensis var. sinensis]